MSNTIKMILHGYTNNIIWSLVAADIEQDLQNILFNKSDCPVDKITK
jgi:hypothetical protein